MKRSSFKTCKYIIYKTASFDTYFKILSLINKGSLFLCADKKVIVEERTSF